MDRSVEQRRIARGLFTKCANKFDISLADENRTRVTVSAAYENLKSKFDNLSTLDNTILNQWLDLPERSEEDYETLIATSEEYVERWHLLQQRYNEFIKKLEEDAHTLMELKSGTSSASSKERLKRLFKLPKLELPKFDGDIRKWLNFWGMYKKIHEDNDLEDDVKFQYLSQCMETGSPAQKMLDSYPPTSANYEKAVEQLKARFGREELLVEIYVRELLSIVLEQSKSGTKTSVATLYDRLKTQLHALESLGVTSDKYAAMLRPLVESALPLELLRVWERQDSKTTHQDQSSTLNDLLTFLKREAESEERIKISRKDITANEPSTSCFTTATGVKENTFRVKKCIFCDKSCHASSECEDAKKMSKEERIKTVKIKNACRICLNVGHWHKICRNRQIKCTKCGKRHYALMCYSLEPQKEAEPEKPQATLCQGSSATVILPTLSLNVVHKDKKITVRALLDSGAQKSFIKKCVAEKLSLVPCGETQVSHNLFGGVVTKKESRKSYKLKLKSCDDKFETEIEALEQPTICQELPKADANVLDILRGKGIHIHNSPNKDIDLLIGADNLGSIMTGNMITLMNNLIATETKFGWTVQGPTCNSSTYSNFNLNVLKVTFDVEDMWKLETLGIHDDAKAQNKTHNEVLDFYKSTVRMNEEDRYEVKLPFKDVAINLPSNYYIALKRLKSNTARLIQLGILDEYDKQFVEWKESGIIEQVTDVDPDSGHYLPHHAVVKEESLTTKIRPVFDASSCQNVNGLSLNSCLETGQNLIELIPPLLLKFRKGSIGVISDIKKAFLQISLYPEDRNYVKFLWWRDINKREEIITYRHRRVVFGVTTSPFLLMATINHHLEKYNTDTAAILKQSFYCDNCVTSVDDEKSLDMFAKEAKEIMLEGNFELRCWVSSGPILLDENITETSVLGLKWNPRTDELYCKVPDIKYKELTKRTLLSLAQSIFDPIGFACPYTLIPKILVQKCWKQDFDWDTKLPDELQKEAANWLQNIEVLSECRIPRHLTHVDIKLCRCTLHTFSDASASAFSACVFLRAEYDGKVTVQLLLAKSRVTPTKSITMPRLELIAALLATRLAAEAKKALNKEVESEYYWSDSSIVLSWIKKESNLNVFVHNRIKEIKTKSKSQDWRHIHGSLNPADLPSRGCTAQALVKSRWWEGPAWLKKPPSEWPHSEPEPDEEEINKEIKKNCLNVQIAYKFSDHLTYFSKYSKTVRMLAWCLRFCENCRRKAKKEELLKTDISGEEFQEAEKKLFRIIQSEEFPDIQIAKKSLNMEIYEDSDKLLRVKTRLTLIKDKENFIAPILLPGSNLIILNLVRQCHVKNCHAGVQILINIMREEYWIVSIRRLAKKIVRECMPCKRLSAKMCSAPTAPLPTDRTRCGHAFDVTGIDLAGPLILRSRDKAWIVLFTCATYRAIHLELVNSLSTEAFLLALRRFIARRGKPNVIYTDNGTNFRGAANLIKDTTSVDKIKWHFIPPQAPWWGGFWERLIKMVKDLMRRMLGKASLDRVALYTILCEIEGVINNRPLTSNTESDNLVPLTPNDFIVPNKRRDTTALDEIDMKTQAKKIVKLREDFKVRFRSEYLAHLVQKQSRQKSNDLVIRPGDMVLVEIQNAKRVNWPLARVIEIFTGVDGHGRAAKIKLANGEAVRPIQRLYALELRPDEPAYAQSPARRM